MTKDNNSVKHKFKMYHILKIECIKVYMYVQTLRATLDLQLNIEEQIFKVAASKAIKRVRDNQPVNICTAKFAHICFTKNICQYGKGLGSNGDTGN
jgi:hypothetical protein